MPIFDYEDDFFHDQIDKDWSDMGARLLLAEHLEARGEEIASYGQRWQVKHGKYPEPNWGWWEAHHIEIGYPEHACLSFPEWATMCYGLVGRRNCEDALADVLVRSDGGTLTL